ncbi:MAG: transporter substrate-binding domain-containing protein [Coriobacteriales bacterium]|nr:transporter substrate-binding domain-containing protein [Coriobacteriales bacterium]
MKTKVQKRLQYIAALIVAGVLALAVLPVSGCEKPASEAAPLLKDPTIAPPTISSPGVLRVGVDSSRSPFAGRSGNTLIGLDIDIAAALADELGLKLETVDVAGLNSYELSDLFMQGRIDIVMSFQPESESLSPFVMVGPYLVDGPAIFTIGLTLPSKNFNPDTLIGLKIAARSSSLSAWQLESRYGSETVVTYTTLEEAFDAVGSGSISYVAADAVAGAYLAGKYPNMLCLGYLEQPSKVYIAVAPGNQSLTDAATSALRTLRDNGILRLVISKWLGLTAADLVLGTNAITGIDIPIGDGPEQDPGDDLPDPSNSDSGELIEGETP